jgi:23S rRNA C2498 (ribose-2'-O)-methylase RlmM
MANTTGKKFGGRKKGTPNKTPQEVKEIMQLFLENQFEKLDEVFEQLKPRDKINSIIKMLPYIVPKQMQMDLTATHIQEPQYDLSKLTTEELLKLVEITDKAKPNESDSE